MAWIARFVIGAIMGSMFLVGLTGFVLGFIVGMIANAYLLRGIDRDELRRNRDLRMKYGLLNWALAGLGTVIALALN